MSLGMESVYGGAQLLDMARRVNIMAKCAMFRNDRLQEKVHSEGQMSP
jgi:hypothetical protein